jgi:CubicO group peptidase (beta-lactamase class C family)
MKARTPPIMVGFFYFSYISPMKKSLITLLLSSIILISNAQSWQDTVNAIDKIFDRYKPNNPGVQLAISRNGQIIYSRAWGMADLEHNAPLTTTSASEAGSVSKQFTAAAILLLEQEGKLSLNDDVRKHLPEMPNYGHVITLRHMIQHTSGLKDWGSIAALGGWPRSTKTYNNNDALYLASLQKTLNNKPGDEFIYSNSNYNLLAVIVERVSGMSLAEYTKKKIFEPAGMKHTQWRDDYKRIVPNRAMAYGKSDKYFTNMPNEYVYGNGGLLTTAEDLVTWTNYYSSGKFGSPALFTKQTAINALNNGRSNAYAAGLFIDKYNGVELISHDGATASYRANLDYFPSLGLSIAFLSNTSEFDRAPVSMPNEVRKVFVPAPAAVLSPPAVDPPTVSAEAMAKHAGWYRNNRSGAGIKVFMRDNKLQSSIGVLVPANQNTYAVGQNQIQFMPEKKTALYITGARDSIYFSAVDSAVATPDKLNEYAGEYYSDEVQATYVVRIKSGKLELHQRPQSDTPLTPTYKDAFDAPFGNLYFERDKKNKVTGFKITVSRARNVSFQKVK